MPITARTPLNKSILNRHTFLDVNTGTVDVPVWTPVNGIAEITPFYNQNEEDISDNDSEGAGFTQVTGYDWGVTLKVRRALNSDKEFDPGQEALRLAALDDAIDERVQIRHYEAIPGVDGYGEAYEGFVSAGWSPDGGGSRGTSMISISLKGQGKRNDIAHPGTPVIP